VQDPRILSEITSVTSTLINLGGDLKPVERENIHLTLKFLGYISESKADEVKRSMATLKFHPFEMEIKGAGVFPSFGRISVIWVGIANGWSEIQKIYSETEKMFADLGFAKENRPFTPHITVARVRSAKNRTEMAEFLKSLSEKSFGSVHLEKVRLKQSVLSSKGPKYSTLFEAPAQS
jgi:2'-5' RNA ligase